MHLIAPVNVLPYGEKTYQQFGGSNTLAPCNLQDEFNNLVFHIGGKNIEWHRTFIVCPPPPQPEDYAARRALAAASIFFRYFGFSA